MKEPPRQLPLALGFQPALAAEDFLVTPCNELAVAWLNRWPDWPAPALVLTGPAGAGKSHLAAIWAGRTGAKPVMPGAKVDLDRAVPPGACLLIDLQTMLHPEPDAEAPWFHLLNLLKERRAHALIVAREPAARWPVRLPDLASRLAALPQVDILAPDETLLAALLVKHLADLGALVDPPVIRYLVPRIERSFLAVSDLAKALNRAALAAQKPITVALARTILSEPDGAGAPE
jgi:chromosomal replication initiation ATPase DnaA